MVNINFGRSKSIIVIFTKIIFATELEFAKSAKFTAHENFALYGRGQIRPYNQSVSLNINSYYYVLLLGNEVILKHHYQL